MKTWFTLVLILAVSFVRAAETPPATLLGAWESGGDGPKRIHLTTENYWVQAIYDPAQKQFLRTFGGTYAVKGDIATGRIEFDSGDATQVGVDFQVTITSDGKKLTIVQENGTAEDWRRIDDGNAPLAGVWRISERKVDDGMRAMPLQARRTLKILTATRFQWVAINVETGEFSGTGGGTYTLKDGKYVEKIEFFSRDASRVGAELSFEAEVGADRWVHRGKSSKGDPIHEVWTRFAASKP